MKCEICNDNKTVIVHGVIDKPLELPCNCTCDKKDIKMSQRENLIFMNYRLSLLLGYCAEFISEYSDKLSSDKKIRYNWLMNSIDNLFYLDKPLPPMPQGK